MSSFSRHMIERYYSPQQGCCLTSMWMLRWLANSPKHLGCNHHLNFSFALVFALDKRSKVQGELSLKIELVMKYRIADTVCARTDPDKLHWRQCLCVWQPQDHTTAKEFPRSVENQLLQLYHPTLPQDRQDCGLLAECPSVQRVIRLWLICHCMGVPPLGWRPSKNSDTGPGKAQTPFGKVLWKKKTLGRRSLEVS